MENQRGYYETLKRNQENRTRLAEKRDFREAVGAAIAAMIFVLLLGCLIISIAEKAFAAPVEPPPSEMIGFYVDGNVGIIAVYKNKMQFAHPDYGHVEFAPCNAMIVIKKTYIEFCDRLWNAVGHERGIKRFGSVKPTMYRINEGKWISMENR